MLRFFFISVVCQHLKNKTKKLIDCKFKEAIFISVNCLNDTAKAHNLFNTNTCMYQRSFKVCDFVDVVASSMRQLSLTI